MGEVPWGWICALSTSGPGEARPGFMQISCEEAEDWLAWVGAGLCPPWTGRVLRPPILLKGPERHLDGNLTYSPQE